MNDPDDYDTAQREYARTAVRPCGVCGDALALDGLCESCGTWDWDDWNWSHWEEGGEG